jgi:hypothetical protein
VTDQAFCPHCGAKRPEWAKFCAMCGNAYGMPPAVEAFAGAVPAASDSTAATPNPVSAYADPPIGADVTDLAPIRSRAGYSLLPALVTVVGLFAVLAASFLLLGGKVGSAGGSGSISADIPPVGQIWFGTGFDPTTFALSGKSDDAPTGRTVAMVAHLAAPVSSGQANVRIELGGTTMADNALQLSGTPAGDVVGFTLAFPIAGSYRVTVTDAGGAALATGVVIAQ